MKLGLLLKWPKMAGLVQYLAIVMLQLDNAAGSNQLDPFKKPEFSTYRVKLEDTSNPLMQISSVAWYTPQLDYPQGLTFSDQHILIKSLAKNNEVCYDKPSKTVKKKEILVTFNSKKKKLTIEANDYPNLCILRTRKGERKEFILKKLKDQANPILTISCEIEDIFELFPSKKGIKTLIEALVSKKIDTETFMNHFTLFLEEKHPNVYYLRWTINEPNTSKPTVPSRISKNIALKWHLNASRWSDQISNLWLAHDPIFKQGTVSSTDLRFAFADLGQDLCPFELRIQNQRYGVIFQEHWIGFAESFKLSADLNNPKISGIDNHAIFRIENDKLISQFCSGGSVVSFIVLRGKKRLNNDPRAPPLPLEHGDRIIFSVAGYYGRFTSTESCFGTYLEAFESLRKSRIMELVVIKGDNTGGSIQDSGQAEHYKLQDIEFDSGNSHSDQTNDKLSQDREQLKAFPKENILFKERIPEGQSFEHEMDGLERKFDGALSILDECDPYVLKTLDEDDPQNDSEMTKEINARFNQSEAPKRQVFSIENQQEEN